jgi:hypothetical protein
MTYVKNTEYVQVPYPIYQNLLNHLQVNAVADGWAAELLEQLQREVKPAYRLPTGSYLLDSEVEEEYRVN